MFSSYTLERKVGWLLYRWWGGAGTTSELEVSSSDCFGLVGLIKECLKRQWDVERGNILGYDPVHIRRRVDQFE